MVGFTVYRLLGVFRWVVFGFFSLVGCLGGGGAYSAVMVVL